MKIVLMEKRDQVIENIERATREKRLNDKVEIDDPQLDDETRLALCNRFLRQYPTFGYRVKRHVARWILNVTTRLVNQHTRIEGIEKIQGIETGAIVTSNHFSPIDNTVVRFTMHKAGKWRMPIVCQESNLAMPALFGFMMRYADTIPISSNRTYMKNEFPRLIGNEMERGSFLFIYPEQEMWFNYRKPRPCKRGAYYYAALFGVPIVSCFVEIVDRDRLEDTDFVEVSYVMHVLDPIYPDPSLTVHQNSMAMCEKDYSQKCAAYEEIYGKPLDYRFSSDDIAGWVPPAEAEEKLDRQRFAADVTEHRLPYDVEA